MIWAPKENISLLESSYSELAIKVWYTDLIESEQPFNWNRICKNMILASHNPNHQCIHLYRLYLTPKKRFFYEIGQNFQLFTVSPKSGRHIPPYDVGQPCS